VRGALLLAEAPGGPYSPGGLAEGSARSPPPRCSASRAWSAARWSSCPYYAISLAHQRALRVILRELLPSVAWFHGDRVASVVVGRTERSSMRRASSGDLGVERRALRDSEARRAPSPTTFRRLSRLHRPPRKPPTVQQRQNRGMDRLLSPSRREAPRRCVKLWGGDTLTPCSSPKVRRALAGARGTYGVFVDAERQRARMLPPYVHDVDASGMGQGLFHAVERRHRGSARGGARKIVWRARGATSLERRSGTA